MGSSVRVKALSIVSTLVKLKRKVRVCSIVAMIINLKINVKCLSVGATHLKWNGEVIFNSTCSKYTGCI